MVAKTGIGPREINGRTKMDDEVLECSHKWRNLLMQNREWPHTVQFHCWECEIAGCDAKTTQEDLEPAGLGGEMTEDVRIIGFRGGPVILDSGYLAKEIIKSDGEVKTHYYRHFE